MQNSKPKYSLKEKLDIAESISTVLMFLMAVWGTIAAYEAGFWHKIMHIIDHYHTEIVKIEHTETVKTIEQKVLYPQAEHSKNSQSSKINKNKSGQNIDKAAK